MASTYTETPDNYSEIKESVVADIKEDNPVPGMPAGGMGGMM